MDRNLRKIEFKLNGRSVTAWTQPHHNLIELLQSSFGLTGAKESCGQGLCGCCSVIVDDRAVSACLFLAVSVDGCDVVTIEGLGNSGELSPVQEAWLECGAFQCGYCTPGFIIMTNQLLKENPSPSDDEIRSYLSGNLCRCGSYPEIVNAVHLAAEKIRQAQQRETVLSKEGAQ